MKITVNGKEYDSWDQVPAELRGTLAGALPDANHDGVPDLFQGGPLPTESIVRTSTQITVGDKTYNSFDEVPEPLRETLRKAGLFGAQASAIPTQPGQQPALAPQHPQQPAYPPLQQPQQPQQPQQVYQDPPQASRGMVTLNGQPYDPNQPETKRHWWNRKG